MRAGGWQRGVGNRGPVRLDGGFVVHSNGDTRDAEDRALGY